jgi:hypothetical protein
VRLEQIMRSVPARLGARMLTFEEVTASRRTALFQEFGDLLLYLDDTVFILQDEDSGADPGKTPAVLDLHSLAHAVGVEIGWRHAEGCDCDLCTDAPQAHAA